MGTDCRWYQPLDAHDVVNSIDNIKSIVRFLSDTLCLPPSPGLPDTLSDDGKNGLYFILGVVEDALENNRNALEKRGEL